ncbi:MAG TPA: cbb3-type cytochrome c oxidase subunit 3 [Polyangiaceae bacterium]|nr:cbb3-type cytochrome c oxidase subunit 3 [Polyangiaceae bacterium]
MKLSDVMSAMHVSVFAQVPLLVFFGIFVGVVLHLMQGKGAFEHARQLPLEGKDRHGGDDR